MTVLFALFTELILVLAVLIENADAMIERVRDDDLFVGAQTKAVRR